MVCIIRTRWVLLFWSTTYCKSENQKYVIWHHHKVKGTASVLCDHITFSQLPVLRFPCNFFFFFIWLVKTFFHKCRNTLFSFYCSFDWFCCSCRIFYEWFIIKRFSWKLFFFSDMATQVDISNAPWPYQVSFTFTFSTDKITKLEHFFQI